MAMAIRHWPTASSGGRGEQQVLDKFATVDNEIKGATLRQTSGNSEDRSPGTDSKMTELGRIKRD